MNSAAARKTNHQIQEKLKNQPRIKRDLEGSESISENIAHDNLTQSFETAEFMIELPFLKSGPLRDSPSWQSV